MSKLSSELTGDVLVWFRPVQSTHCFPVPKQKQRHGRSEDSTVMYAFILECRTLHSCHWLFLDIVKQEKCLIFFKSSKAHVQHRKENALFKSIYSSVDDVSAPLVSETRIAPCNWNHFTFSVASRGDHGISQAFVSSFWAITLRILLLLTIWLEGRCLLQLVSHHLHIIWQNGIKKNYP